MARGGHVFSFGSRPLGAIALSLQSAAPAVRTRAGFALAVHVLAVAGLPYVAWADVEGTPFYNLEYIIDPVIPGYELVNPTRTEILGVNDASVLVGYNAYNGLFDKAFLIQNGVVTGLKTTSTGYARAVAVNSSNHAVGWKWGQVNPSGLPRAVRWIDPEQGDVLTGLGEESQAWDINNTGVIVGWSRARASQPMQAFRWEDGEALLLGTLGGDESQAFGINASGSIVGGAEIANGQMRPFVWQDGTMTDLGDLSEAGGAGGFARDISDTGIVVGTMFTANGERAFRWEDGQAQDLGVMYTFDRSEAWAVNDAGDIVGRMWHSGNPAITRAFVWRNGQMYDLEPQVINIDSTDLKIEQAYDINASGQIVGFTHPGSRGYITTLVDAQFEYTVTHLGTPPTGAFNVIPIGLNEQGEAVGWLYDGDFEPEYRAWKWTAEQGMILLPATGTGNGFAATVINSAGQIAGADVVAFGDDSAWRFGNGSYTFVGLLPGTTWSMATGINASGDVVGYGDDYTPGPGNTRRGFIYTDQTGLLEIPDDPDLTGIGRINDQQVLTGRSTQQAFRWSIGGGMDLIPYPGGFSYGYDINESGQVSGIVAVGAEKYGALYTDGVGWQLIANIVGPGGQQAPGWEYGLAVNNNSEVVGYSEQDNPSEGYEIAWVWDSDRGLRILDDVIEPTALPSWFHLYRAVDINDKGQILAEGTGLNGELHSAFLLTPTGASGEPKEGDLTGDGTAGVPDLLMLLSAWGECADLGACDADLDGDGSVGVPDLLVLLAAWG